VALVLLCRFSSARAADPAEVETLIREGVKLRRAGENHRALPIFRKAYDLARTPRTSAQLGLVEMSLGYPMEAEKHLMEALAVKHDFWVDHNRKVLNESLASVQAAIGELQIEEGPDGAEVQLNGKPAGTLPEAGQVRAAEGPIEVVVRAPGYLPFKASRNVVGGKRIEIVVSLQRERPAPAPTIALAPVSDVADGLVRGSDEVAVPPAPPSRPAVRTVAWGLAAAAVAAGVLGAVETVTWSTRRDDFDNHLGPARDNPALTVKSCGVADPNRGGTGCSDLYENMARARTLMLIGYGAAGALTATAVILFLVSAPGESGPSHATACAPAGASLGAVCRFVF
jgi:hypothetical protein